MQQLTISDMTCSHCVGAVEKAVKAVDPNAKVAVNLETGSAEIESTIGTEALIAAIADAGYKASAEKSCCGGAA